MRRIESIFHPSDFSQASEIAFAHALKIALVSRAALNMMHVAADPDADWGDFPGVRETLERWKLIPQGSPKSAVPALGIDVTKIIASSRRPVKACVDFLDKHPADIIVLAVRQFEGRMQWLEKSIGGTVAQRAGEVTLYLPPDVRGFVAVAPRGGSDGAAGRSLYWRAFERARTEASWISWRRSYRSVSGADSFSRRAKSMVA